MTFRQPDESDTPLSSAEDSLHRQGLAKMQAAFREGKTFTEAVAVLADLGEGLRELIADDFLKIFIAEEHFQKGRTIGEVAAALELAYERIAAARDAMLEEVGMEMARQYRREIGQQSH